MTDVADVAGPDAVRVVLPHHLRRLAGVSGEVLVEVPAPATVGSVVEALEAAYPTLAGAIRDRETGRRRPFVRYFACEVDLSHSDVAELLPEAVRRGAEPLLVVGAMAGG